MDMVAEPGPAMTIHAAEPGSSTEHALALLSSWGADQVGPAARPI
jgi:hypothetical protein